MAACVVPPVHHPGVAAGLLKLETQKTLLPISVSQET